MALLPLLTLLPLLALLTLLSLLTLLPLLALLTLLPLLALLTLLVLLPLLLAPFALLRRHWRRLRQDDSASNFIRRLQWKTREAMRGSEAGQARENSARRQQTPKLCHHISYECG